MANWKYSIKLGVEFQQYHDKKIAVADLSKAIANKLKNLLFYTRDEKFRDIVKGFDDLSCPAAEATIDDFDDAMRGLYDWGDTPLDNKWHRVKMCWIDTFYM